MRLLNDSRALIVKQATPRCLTGVSSMKSKELVTVPCPPMIRWEEILQAMYAGKEARFKLSWAVV